MLCLFSCKRNQVCALEREGATGMGGLEMTGATSVWGCEFAGATEVLTLAGDSVGPSDLFLTGYGSSMQIFSTFRFACLGFAGVLDSLAGLGLGLLPERARVLAAGCVTGVCVCIQCSKEL